MNEWEPVEDLTEIMVYGSVERTNMEATVARKLVAVNAYRQQWVGLSLPLQRFRTKAGRKKDQESVCGGRGPDTGDEPANVGDDQGDGGVHRRMRSRGEYVVERSESWPSAWPWRRWVRRRHKR